MKHNYFAGRIKTPQRALRGGFTLIECLGAFAVLAGAMLLLLLSLGMLRQTERTFNQRQWAVESAANLLAVADAVPYAELTPEKTQALAAELPLLEQLSGGKSELLLREDPAALPPQKRLQARILWNSPGGQLSEVSLERVRFAAVQEAKP